MNTLINSFSLISLKKKNTNQNIIRIQKWYCGNITRLKLLPLIMYNIQKYLIGKKLKFSKINEDGRINSCIDESIIINILVKKYKKRIKKPKSRMWYDILAFDYIYGWIPINIKTTTTVTADNTGNLAMCVYSYTDEILNFDKSYNNKQMSEILFTKLKEKKYNTKKRLLFSSIKQKKYK
jgi:hypothetical protein